MSEKGPLSHVAAGLLIGGVLVLYQAFFYVGGIDINGVYAAIPFLIIIAGLIFFIHYYGRARYYQLGFGELFSYGFKTTAILALVVIVCTSALLIAFPDIKEKAIETAHAKMLENKDLSQADIDKAISLTKRMFWLFTIGGIILTYAVIGAISSAIGAALVPKKPVHRNDQLSF